jgi:hypothetical protein
MNRIFRLTLTLLVVTTAIGAVAIPAVAQEATNSSAATPEPERSTTIQLSPTTRIDAWQYENSTFHVTITSQIPTRVTITDAGALTDLFTEGQGAATGKVNDRTVTITPGTQTVEFRAEEIDGAAGITLKATNGQGIVGIRTDTMGGDRRPVEWQTTAGLVLAAAVGAAYWTYREAKKRWEDEKKEVSRIA